MSKVDKKPKLNSRNKKMNRTITDIIINSYKIAGDIDYLQKESEKLTPTEYMASMVMMNELLEILPELKTFFQVKDFKIQKEYQPVLENLELLVKRVAEYMPAE